MSDKEEKVVPDSGIDSSRKSRSSGGSFGGGGLGKSSFDNDDSGHASRRGTFDDDYDDDYIDPDEVKVDLNDFLDQVPPGDDVGDAEDEEEEGSEESDGEGEEEDDEGEYETEEEETPVSEVAPSVEASTKTYEQLLEEQEEHKIKTLKQKRKSLINEYLKEVKHFHHIKTKNLLLGLKIMTHMDQQQAVVEKYMQRELEEQEKLREAEKARKALIREKCGFIKRSKKKDKDARKRSKQRKLKMKNMHTRFSEEHAANSSSMSDLASCDTLHPRKFHVPNVHEIPNVSLRTLGKTFNYNFQPVQEQRLTRTSLDPAAHAICKRRKYLKDRIGRKLRRFSFMRSQFFQDAVKKKTRIRNAELMDIDLGHLTSRSSRYLEKKYGRDTKSTTAVDATASGSSKSTRKATQKINVSAHHIHGTNWKSKFAASKEALNLAKSKSRMALDHRKQEQKIRLHVSDNESKNLHQFKFEFFDPSLTSKQKSMALREEFLRMLSSRQIPTSQLRWPMEIKDVEFEEKNPYGRVTLNYVRLSHNDKEFPHTAYRMLLTNMAYFRMKSQKMLKKHNKSMIKLDAERTRLQSVLQEVLREIIDAIRIFISLCGITDIEKKEARREGEGFIQELEKFYNECLMERLIKLYSAISSCEFALRRLWVSEGKGEGGELHDLKEIIRCREKLKAEHKNIEKGIMRYQHHSSKVYRTVQKSGNRIRGAKESVIKLNTELNRMKKALEIMIEGMYVCQDTSKHQEAIEIQFKNDLGINNSPLLTVDFERTLRSIEDRISQRLDLQRQYNSKVRDMEKIAPPPARFVRYKLRS